MNPKDRPLEPPKDAVPPSGGQELSAANLAALQKEILRQEKILKQEEILTQEEIFRRDDIVRKQEILKQEAILRKREFFRQKQEEIRKMEEPGFALQKLKVRELFDRSVPFFTKSAIKKLKDQLDTIKSMAESGRSTDGQKFVFSSITGQTIERAVLKNLTRSVQFGKEKVLLEPCLLYTTYQSLMNHRYSDQALCPLQICYGGHEEQNHSSLQETRDAFHSYRGTWEASEDCLRLKSSMAAAASLPGITKIVAFACSSMSRDDAYTRHRSATQHALILTFRDLLQASQPGVEIRCLAQDPVYTEADRTVLSEVGVTVVDDPQGFLEVDDQSVVLSFSPNVCVRQIITDLARPVVLAWDTVLTEEQTIGRWAAAYEPPKGSGSAENVEARLCDPESSRVRTMVREEYVHVENLDTEDFGYVSVYIRCDGRRTREKVAPFRPEF